MSICVFYSYSYRFIYHIYNCIKIITFISTVCHIISTVCMSVSLYAYMYCMPACMHAWMHSCRMI